MKTCFTIEGKFDLGIFHTVGTGDNTSIDTEEIDYSKIMKPKNMDVSNINFLYEKERMKAMHTTDLYNSLNTIKVKNTDPHKKNIDDKNCNSFIKCLKSDPKGEFIKIANLMKIVSIVITLAAVLNFLAIIGGMIYFQLLMITFEQFGIWVLIDIIYTTMFIYVSVKGINANNFTICDIERYIKYVVIYLILLLTYMMIVLFEKGPIESFDCALNCQEETDRTFSIVLIFIWFSSIYKFVSLIGSCIILIILRKKSLISQNNN